MEKKPIIDWEYCECGCHCFHATIGGIFFEDFVYWHTLPDGKPNYNSEAIHRLTCKDGVFHIEGRDELDNKILEILEKNKIEENLKDQLNSFYRLRRKMKKLKKENEEIFNEED